MLTPKGSRLPPRPTSATWRTIAASAWPPASIPYLTATASSSSPTRRATRRRSSPTTSNTCGRSSGPHPKCSVDWNSPRTSSSCATIGPTAGPDPCSCTGPTAADERMPLRASWLWRGSGQFVGGCGGREEALDGGAAGREGGVAGLVAGRVHEIELSGPGHGPAVIIGSTGPRLHAPHVHAPDAEQSGPRAEGHRRLRLRFGGR